MKELHNMLCIPCPPESNPMPENQCKHLLVNIPEWKIENTGGNIRLQRTFTFPDFRSALDFTNRIGELAEAEQHHPELVTSWGKVIVNWWTHTIKGLHINDFIMAARTSALDQTA